MGQLPKIQVLEPKAANHTAEWKVPFRTGIVALVYGPQGVSPKKVKDFFAKDEDLIAQLADYAEKTAQTEALMAAISGWSGQSSGDVDAALNGFASQYGYTNSIDRTLPREQQTLALMRSINPSLSTVDPVAQDPAQRTAQSAALATSVAGIFFGTPVGLAAGGGALFMNLRGMMFPNTEFRSSFAQVADHPSDKLDLCGKRDPARPRMRVAYLWATRIPNVGPPVVKIEAANHLPAGQKAPLAVSLDDAGWKVVDRAHDWKLTSADGKTAYTAKVKSTPDHKALELDLTDSKASAGRYRLQADWDWDTMHAIGDVYVSPLGEFRQARLVPDMQDRLIEHQGKMLVQVENADFEFVERALISKKDDKFSQPTPVPVSLPKGKQEGPQDRLDVLLDTSGMSAGEYMLELFQTDGKPYHVPVRVLPPGPRIANLPLILNEGESDQKLELHGEHLEQLARLESKGAAFKLGPAVGGSRELRVELKPDAHVGDQLDLQSYAQNTTTPAVVPGAVKVVGPRPRILGAQVALPPKNQVTLLKDELPAGAFVSVSLSVKHAKPGTAVHLSCDAPGSAPGSQKLTLRAGEQGESGSAHLTSSEALFLSFDPGTWPAGCTVTAVLENKGEGQSNPFVLAKVVRVPQVEKFELTDEKIDENYVGRLTGTDLEVIARVGWNPDSGIPVTGLPAPVGGESRKQSLQIALPWPPPSPRAPLWIWFRGDTKGRETTIHYGDSSGK